MRRRSALTTITTDVRTPAEEPATPAPVDERLGFRGPIQRVLVRPEIGALVGTTAVWVFFWSVAEAFGTAAGTANYLDVAAVLGIMAVAVSLLMIGGEFDLSSGAMTGATAMLVILLSKEVGANGGAGLSLYVAVPLAFLFALTIGWFNGTIVEKTRLPSFIVTLGTFFMLIGAKLSFAKLFSGQVTVEGLNEAKGYDFWREDLRRQLGAATTTCGRAGTTPWTALLIAGVACIAIGVLEMSYQRRAQRNRKGVIAAAVGAAIAAGGFFGLLNTDGVGPKLLYGTIVGVGVIGAVLAWAMWRFHPIGRRGRVALDGRRRAADRARLLAIVAAVVVAWRSNPDSENAVGILVSDEFARICFVIGLAVAGVLAVLVAAGRYPCGHAADRHRHLGGAGGRLPDDPPGCTFRPVRPARPRRPADTDRGQPERGGDFGFGGTGGGAADRRRLCRARLLRPFRVDSAKFRTELFTVMLLISLALACSALLGYLFAGRTGPDERADKLGQRGP